MAITKIGIIGLGTIAQSFYLPILSTTKNIKIDALCDIDKIRLHHISKKYNVHNTFTDLKSFFEFSDYDAIFVLTPTESHKEIAEKYSNKCKFLYVEKPIARTLKEADEIINLSIKKNINLFIGLNLRFRPDSIFLKSLLDTQSFGNPFLIRIGNFKPKTFTSREKVQSVILDLGITNLDLALWLANYPKIYSITAKSNSINNLTVDDYASCFIKTENDLVISIDLSRTLEFEKEIFYCNLFSNLGYAFLNPLRISKNIKENNNQILQIKNLKNENQSFKSYNNEIKYFLNCVNGLLKFNNNFDEVILRMKIIEAFFKSCKVNKEIKL